MNTFPHSHEWRLVVAATDDNGEPDFFVGATPEALLDEPGIAQGAWYWRVENGHSLENPGSPPTTFHLAGPNGSTFGVMCIPARSAGKVDAATASKWGDEFDATDPAMHATKTTDYDVVISGKVDIELPGGKIHTLVPGDLLVMTGVTHAWKNPYDEDCLFISVTVGFNEETADSVSMPPIKVDQLS